MSQCQEQQLALRRCSVNISLSLCPYVFTTPPCHAGTHNRQNQTKEVGGVSGFQNRGVCVQESTVPDLTIPICPHRPLLSRSKPAGTAGHKDSHRRQPPGGASIHLVSWVRSWRWYLPAWAPGASDQRQKHLDCAMPCPPAPAQFMNTPHRAGQLLRSLEPTTFSLKSRGLSNFSGASVTGNRTR